MYSVALSPIIVRVETLSYVGMGELAGHVLRYGRSPLLEYDDSRNQDVLGKKTVRTKTILGTLLTSFSSHHH